MTQIVPPTSEEVLGALRPGHPRLLLTNEDLVALRQRVQTDPTLADWHRKLRARAEKILVEPPSTYDIPDGLRLLSTSRRVLDRVTTLGLLHRLHADERYLNRAWAELESAAAFPNWNPRHFLDTAEMAHAFAIGYDWMYESWTEDRKTVLRKAMVRHALEPALDAYHGRAAWKWWAKIDHNWNQVCNGGIAMAALALADEEPAVAGEILHEAIASIRIPMRTYAPDGAWPEGPGYWHYATSYNVLFLAALECALGTDYGLSDAQGFDQTGFFPIYTTGPFGKTFNFADAAAGQIRAPELFWLARRFDAPALSRAQVRAAAPAPLDLVWYRDPGQAPTDAALPLDRLFRGPEVVTMRSAWDDPEAVFVAFKGGDNRANHGHLDLGTFVIDARGERWAVDLGSDNYNLPGYFGKERWNYYRLRTEGHNTLVIEPGDSRGQDPDASAKMVRFESGPDRAFAVADLSSAYAPTARTVRRGVALVDRSMVVVQDEVACEPGATLRWFMHTRAEIDLLESGRAAKLRQNGRELLARVVAPAAASFQVLPAQPLPGSPDLDGQKTNDGIRKLALELDDVADTRVTVLLVPLKAGVQDPGPTFPTRPLAEW